MLLVHRAARVATVAWLSVCGATFAADSGSSKSQALVGGWSGSWSGASTGHIARSVLGAVSITIKGTLEGSTINGTYEAKENQGGSNLDTGTWTASASKT